MPRTVAVVIRSKINVLALDPFAANNNVKKLKGSDDYRLRVGDWRVVYSLENDAFIIKIVCIAPRGGVYD